MSKTTVASWPVRLSIVMKRCLLLVLCLAAAGCRQEDHQAEVLARLKTLEAELAKRPVPVRWAYADKSRIQAAIYARTREKLADLKRADALPPEVEAQVAQYEALHWQLIKPRRKPSTAPPSRAVPDLLPPKQLSVSHAPISPSAPPIQSPTASPALPTTEELDYEALAKRVVDAKAPVAAIVERRAAFATKYHSPQFLEQLVADYVKEKEHYDVVVDSSNESLFSRPVLYRTAAEVPDITEGVIKLFQAREKP